MLKGMYIAASGMAMKVHEINEAAGNMANVSTPGYKRTQTIGESFGDLVTQFRQPTPFDRVGMGVRESETARFESQGTLVRTANPLQLAITGDGYFQTSGPTGTVTVTRNGDFRLDNAGYLATQIGERVLGVDNQPIQLGVVGTQTVSIRSDGVVMSGTQEVARIKVISPQNVTSENFPRGNVADPAINTGFKVEQGYLENSNLSVISEMVNMIEISKAYNFAQKAITSQDNLLSKTVSDLGRVQ